MFSVKLDVLVSLKPFVGFLFLYAAGVSVGGTNRFNWNWTASLAQHESEVLQMQVINVGEEK